ncbi:MAG: flagellar hook-basal body protein [Chlamydiales bacterium]|nr:flagellar hook-basal body protein [Chlamydiales bacterium]
MSSKALAIGVSSLKAKSQKMDVIANNLANLNTTAFKQGAVNYEESFYDTLKAASQAAGNIGGTNPMTIGNGVQIGSITNLFTQGNRITTGRTLDFMVQGNDFMVVKNGIDDSLMLTRNGAFQLDGDMTLVDNLGNQVQGFAVDRETGVVASSASSISIPPGNIQPHATTEVNLEANIDSSAVENVANSNTNAWEIFSAGENFGHLEISAAGGSGSRSLYGSGYYQDSVIYQDTAATINGGLATLTLSGAPIGLIDGFRVGDKVSVLQGTVQEQKSILAVNTATSTITFDTALSGTFSAATASITNLTNGYATMGSSGATNINNDVLRSQVSLIDADGKLLASFYRVANSPQQYSRATANVSGGSTMTVGLGEFTDMAGLANAIELALSDTQLTNYAASSNLSISYDKYGQVTFSGSGLVQTFRLVVNAENTEMLDRFSGIAITDNAALATTQARVDSSGEVIAPPALALGARAATASKAWYGTTGLENYGYTSTAPATEYGEFAGLHLYSGADGTGFGILQMSMVNGLGQTVNTQFQLVPRAADPNNNEFTTLGDLTQLLQNTLRSNQFSTVADAGSLINDASASVTLSNGRLTVSTTNGTFNNLKINPMNSAGNSDYGVSRSDQVSFGTVLGELTQGVNGKQGVSNQFLQADIMAATKVFDSQGNEHTMMSYMVKDRSSGLTNIEWKYRNALNPTLNTFAETDIADKSIYGTTFNTVSDSNGSSGVLAFDVQTGSVLGTNAAGSDSRYRDNAKITFTPQMASQQADALSIAIDLTAMTSYNGKSSIIGQNVDGFPMGSLVRIISEENTGNISGVYSNGKTRVLAKLGLMSITNPEGLQKIGSSYYSQTPNSSRGGNTKGLDQIFAVGAQAPASSDSVQSKINGGALEASNVDMTEQITQMIETQRDFSASGKSITTADEMLQEALSLKR